jgi:translation initiation factor IF-3
VLPVIRASARTPEALLHEEPPVTEQEPDLGGPISAEPRINDRIRVPEVRLVGPNGEQVGVVRIEDALRLAQEADLDLVEVAPDARPPVCKLMDFGKFKYESAMKAREARRNQTNTVIKEMKLRPKIDPHDYETKKGHIERFLRGGDKVKVTIMFRGREQSRPELGRRLLDRLATDVLEFGIVESAPKQDGRNMIMVIAPTRKKSEAKAERDAEKRRLAADQAKEAAATQAAKVAHAVEAAEVTEAVIEAEATVVPAAVEVVEVAEAAPTPAAVPKPAPRAKKAAEAKPKATPAGDAEAPAAPKPAPRAKKAAAAPEPVAVEVVEA